MCGIAGIYSKSELSDSFIKSKIIERMIYAQKNRGPDKIRVLKNKKTLLGSARLEIIDASGGQQPFINENKDVFLIFNGEIFNYLELREILIKKNHKFKTKSDTEVLLKMYIEYGFDMLEHLNGQFAFAIVDLKKELVFLARDRMGIRPLFYHIDKENIYFASTIKSILTNENIYNEFNSLSLFQTANLWTNFSDTTSVKNIKNLEPGNFLVFQKDKYYIKKYWDLEYRPILINSFNNIKEDVYNLLNDSTDIRLRSDFKVSSYFSGGLDSSILMYLLNNKIKNADYYSLTFEDSFYDESSYQSEVCKHLEINNLKQLKINNKMIGEMFENVVGHVEQPLFRTAPVPLYYLSKKVQDNDCKVVLTGEGADEISLGYDLFKEIKLRQLLYQNSKSTYKEINYINRFLDQSDEKYQKFMLDFYKKFSTDISSPHFSHQIKFNNYNYFKNFFSDNTNNEFRQFDIERQISNTIGKKLNTLSKIQQGQFLEFKTLLPNYLLSSQGDRMSMANSIEGRYPFLDHRVVEYFYNLPEEYKLNNFNEKYILKETFKNFLPEKIINRHKHPYRAPEAKSLIDSKKLIKFIEKTSIDNFDIFDSNMILKLINKINKTKNDSFIDNFILVTTISTQILIQQIKNRFKDCIIYDNSFEQVECIYVS